MPSHNQAGKKYRRVVKRRLLDLEMGVGELATKVKHDISVVSKAINHGRFPRVRAKILEALDVR